MKKIIVLIFFILFSGVVNAVDNEELHTYVKLLKAGCSVDADTELDITADGKLVVLNKTKIGGASFDLKVSETQNILKALKNDSLKGSQASEQRDCQKHYLDKIFSSLFPNEEKPSKTEVSKSGGGYLFELRSCNIVERNSVNCKFNLTSSFYDRKIRLRPHMYDNFGNEYAATFISIANFSNKGKYLDASLIADITTLANIKFGNVNTQATGIAKLHIIDGVEFRNLSIIRE